MKADMENQDDVEYIPVIEYPDRDSDDSSSSEAVSDFDDFPSKYYDSELAVDLDDASECMFCRDYFEIILYKFLISS